MIENSMFFRPGSGFFFVPSNFEFVLQCVCMMFSLGSIFIYSRMGWVCTKQQRCDHKPRSQAIAGTGNHQLGYSQPTLGDWGDSQHILRNYNVLQFKSSQGAWFTSSRDYHFSLRKERPCSFVFWGFTTF
jgi:hypothetical protein